MEDKNEEISGRTMKRNVEKGNIVTEREERLCERIRKIEREKNQKNSNLEFP